MKVSVIFPDSRVYVDGYSYKVDLPEAGIHAIQWDGKRGEIEYKEPARPNEIFTSYKVVAPYVKLWKKQERAEQKKTSPQPYSGAVWNPEANKWQ